jgi:Tol biopolymer transport system component
VFSKYDLATRQTREFARVENFADFDLFHDGSRIAVLIRAQAKRRIRVVRLSGETELEFAVEGLSQNIYCSADGAGLYLSSVPGHGLYTLLYTDLRGQTRTVWQSKGGSDWGSVRASPDGRYLSITGKTGTSDAWLLENF